MIVFCNFCLWSGNVELGTETCPYCKEINTLLEGSPEDYNIDEEIPEEVGLDNGDPDVDIPYCNESSF